MGLDYHIYKPKLNLELSKAIDLVHENYVNSIKNEYSEYFIEFSLVNTEKYPLILEAFQLKGRRFYFFSPEFSCQTLDYLPTIRDFNLYTNCRICSHGYYKDDAIGYTLQINNETLELILDIGLPYSDLIWSKQLLSELIRHLNLEGVYLGLSDYDNVEEFVNQLINLNSSVKPSFTWQLNIFNYSYSHNNEYALNSNFGDKNSETYRMRGIRIRFPKHYFKHKNIDERNKISNYSSRLIKALSKYFTETSSIQFTSKNLELLKSCESSTKDNFKLSSRFDLSDEKIRIDSIQLQNLFETGYNEYSLTHIKLNENIEFHCNLSIVKEEDENIELIVYSKYVIDKEKEHKEMLEKLLNLELEYFGVE